MANPIITQIKMPSGNVYDITDQGARDLIAQLLNFTRYIGVTTSALTDGSTLNPITIDGESFTAQAGDVATLSSDSSEFIFDSLGKWNKFGTLSGLGALAYKDSASGSYTPAGSISGITGGTKSIKQFKSQGSLPTVSMPTFAVSNNCLEITDGSYTAGTLPTGEDVTVGDGSISSQGSFSGTAATITVS